MIKKIFVCISFFCIFFAILKLSATQKIDLPENNKEAVILLEAHEQQSNITLHPDGYNVFDLVEKLTGTDRRILAGYAATEGHWSLQAVGDDGISLGLMQLNEYYRKDHEKLCGYHYDPFDLFDSVYLCGLIVQQNKRAFTDTGEWVTAYCRGITGVKKHGVIDWYVKRVTRYLNG
jgi:hypothetical protein